MLLGKPRFISFLNANALEIVAWQEHLEPASHLNNVEHEHASGVLDSLVIKLRILQTTSYI